jgi:DNA-directed RNA polymerase subunit E'/Rpb7
MEKTSQIYSKSLLNTKIMLHVIEIGKQLKQTLENKLISKIANKCISEGYVSPNDIKIITYSSGTVWLDSIVFEVVYECMISHPVEGMQINATVQTVTKAGIHANVTDRDANIPVTVFVARDHNLSDKLFQIVNKNDSIIVKIIGIRYELNDPNICVIASIVQINEKKQQYVKSIITNNDEYDDEDDIMNNNIDI